MTNLPTGDKSEIAEEPGVGQKEELQTENA